MSDIKLLPCPFCGGEADFGGATRSWIKCKGCGFETGFVNDNKKLVNIWNTRKGGVNE